MSVRQILAWTAAGTLILGPLGCRSHRNRTSGPYVDPTIAQAIAAIWAVDNHAHPVLAPPLDATDRGYDALPVSSMAPESDPVALRPDYPLQVLAWKALYGFDAAPPLNSTQLQQLYADQRQAKAEHGENYPAWVLDQAHIGTELGNRVFMGRGVEPPRFRWVPYVDALLFPLDNRGLAAANPDRQQFFALEDLCARAI